MAELGDVGRAWLPLVLGASTILYALGVIWFVTGMRWRPGCAARVPLVSVVVAARDEERNIEQCLRALLAQDYPVDRYEILVVDDGSVDGTAARVQALSTDQVQLLSSVREHGSGGSKKAALTLGIQTARGEIILTTDADCRVPSSWVRAMVRYFEDDVGLVIGFSQIGTAGSLNGKRAGYEAADFLALMGCIAGSTGHGHPMAASGQNLGYRKTVFHEVGGYAGVMHRASGDDAILLQRVRRRSRWRVAFAYCAEAHVVHPPAGNVPALLQKRTRWASNAPHQLFLDPLFFAYMLDTYVLSGLLLLSPALLAAGLLPFPWIAAGCLGKMLSEFLMHRRATALFGRQDLHRYFLLWAVLQPLHVLYVGAMGCAGVFTWKGQAHRWGRRVGETGGTRR